MLTQTTGCGQERIFAANSSHGGVVLFEVEKKARMLDPSTAHVSAALKKLRSYGPSSFASLTDKQGNYLQEAGGGLTCLLERRVASGAHHFRAYLETPSGLHSDGIILAFAGGEVTLQADEWISGLLVIEAFTAFLQGNELPQTIRWRDITSLLGN